MGCRILTDRENGKSVFYCSTTDVAFGPVMVNEEAAEKFLEWLPGDPRNLNDSELIAKYGEFVDLYVCECGELREDKCSNCDDDLPLGVDRIHRWTEYKENFAVECQQDPEPKPGERFCCARCQTKDAAKAAKK